MKKLQPATLIAQLKSIIFIFLTLIIVNQLTAQTQATDHFRSRQSGDWGDTLTWESSIDLIQWETANLVPTSAASSILIMADDSVFTSNEQTAKDLIIESNGKLTINALFSIFDYNGAGLTVYGKIELNNYLATSTLIIIKDGGCYVKDISKNFRLNLCSWEDGSTIKLKMSTLPTNSITNLGQIFHDFVWDGKGQLSDYNLNLPSTFSCTGDFTTLSTKGFKLILSQSSTSIEYNIDGDLNLKDNSYLILSMTTGPVTMNIGNDINLGDNINWCRIDLGTINMGVVNINGNLIISNSSKIFSTKQGGTLRFINTSQNQEIIYIGTGKTQYLNFVVAENGSVSTDKFIIDAGYSLTLESGSSLTSNTLTNSNSNNFLVIKNGASLITNSSTVRGTMQRTLSNADWGVSQDGWHLLSSPVVAQNLSTGGFLEGNYDFYEWSEPRNLWLNQKVAVNNITSFVPGHGYFVAYQNGGTKSFAGVFNSASQVFNNLTITSNSPNSGYHLLGNPFPCALDWGSGSWNRLNVSNVANVWNETASNYLPITISTDNIIPANQGFFVQAVAPVNSITIPADARVHSNQAFYKKTEVAEILHLKMKCSENETWDETIIQLDPDAFTSFDQMDGHEMQGSENAPQIYTILAEDEMLCVNALPLNDIPPVIPLYFRTGAGNNYTLEVLDNTISRPVYLEDLLTGTIQQLEKSLTLPLTASYSENRERFRLHMGPVRLPENESKPTLQVYSSGNSIYFKNSSADEMNVEFVVTDLSGKVIHCGKPGNSALSTVRLPNLITGVYLVTAISSDRTEVFKIYIQN